MFTSQQQSMSYMAFSTNICSRGSTNFVTSTNMTSGISSPYYNAERSRRDTDYPLCCVQHRNLSRKHRERVLNQRPEKLITKRNRKPVFTTHQILALEKIFNKKQHVNRHERQVLMERLNVSERVIKLWFKNRRRLSGQREIKPNINYNSDSSGEETGNNFNLDYVQSKINEPDEFGYVTLDDRAMKELITVIDLLLTDVDLDEICIELKNQTSFDSLKYEPVSPVSIHSNADENICIPLWELYEPEESLRRLFDVQAMITK